MKNERCNMCGKEIDGSLMRMNPRYHRVRAMLTSWEVPKTEDGGCGLCHYCQRYVYFQGGYLAMMVRAVKQEARAAKARERAAKYHKMTVPQFMAMREAEFAARGIKAPWQR